MNFVQYAPPCLTLFANVNCEQIPRIRVTLLSISLIQLFIFLYLVFESAKISGAYKFPEYSQLDLYNGTSRGQVSSYIRLPQKLLSKDQCKYYLAMEN